MIIFPADSLERTEVERDYRSEWDAAQTAGFQTAIFDFDALRRQEPIERVLRRVPETTSPQTLIYRGWMLRAEDYARLCDGLARLGWACLSGAEMYRFAHHAPENYEFWREQLPETKWIEREKFEQNGEVNFAPILETLRPFGSAALIVKDWVKSQKHKWNEACFIPNARDETDVRRVVTQFLELTGENLIGGLVFRRFEKLKPGEWRSFWLDGELLSLSPNPSGDETPDLIALFTKAKSCLSRFFSLDWAQKESGEWMLIEMGDGGVSGLPLAQEEDVEGWYRALKRQREREA